MIRKLASEGYRIRDAQPDDLPIVLGHRRRMFERMGHTDPVALHVMEESSRPLFAQGLADGSYRGWLVEAGGTVVAGGGIVLIDFPPHPIDPRPRRAFVVNMFTEPEHRRRGLARLLMDAMLAWSRERGLPSLSLHASDEARALYARLGFEPTNEMRLILDGSG